MGLCRQANLSGAQQRGASMSGSGAAPKEEAPPLTAGVLFKAQRAIAQATHGATQRLPRLAANAAAATAGHLLRSPLCLAHALACFDALTAHLSGGQLPQQHLADIEDVSCPLFVSWHKRSRLSGENRLRGCIGTLEPRPLRMAVHDYALTSALRDRRFPPIEARELPHLRCTVSLLSCFEVAARWEDWEIGKHGLIIEFTDPHSSSRRTATFLPEVAAHEGWDKLQTIDHLIRKAGYNGAALAVRASLKVTRYQSTTFSLSYEDYQKQAEAAGRPAVRSRGRKEPALVAVGASQ